MIDAGCRHGSKMGKSLRRCQLPALNFCGDDICGTEVSDGELICDPTCPLLIAQHCALFIPCYHENFGLALVHAFPAISAVLWHHILNPAMHISDILMLLDNNRVPKESYDARSPLLSGITHGPESATVTL
ncbi:hypothetical protein [Planobispora longispora]|uniref:hypothetical protein n=1 Tax=Planobispora longispora TaxID=28887 RepID=UPI001945A4B0|nr:hypothetical protein [Planobispora longispora]